MKSEKEKFTLKKKSIEDEFKTEYRKVQQLLNTTVHLAISFENDNDFMLAFQNEFSEAPKIPDVSKYWIGLYSKQKVDEVFLIQKGILEKEKTTLTETKLLEKRKEFFELVTKNKAPKECYTHNIKETNIYKQFKAIEEILNRFKEMKGFDTSVDSLVKQAEEFGKGLISEIQNINYEPIRNRIIEVIIKDKENFNSYLNGYNNRNFKAQEFNDNYAKAKMYLNNYLKQILETKNQQVKTEKLDESKNINISLEDFLFNPSDKHKIPLIVEKFKNEKGKSMAIAIYLLKELNIFNYELNSKTKGRANLAIFLNPNIKMNGVNMHFTSNTYNLKSLYPDDLNQTKQWLNGL